MKNFISLKILDKFRFLYEKLGVDYDAMRLILSTKLTIDSRKTSNLLNNNQFQESSNQYKIMQIIYALIGFCMMIIIINIQNIFITMAIYFSIFTFFMLTTFMSDFSSVILDVKDKGILSTRGLDAKTLNASKITHIMIYMISTSIALSGFSLIVSIKYGLIFTLVFAIEILLINIFMIIVSGLVYLVILKLFKGEKLKDAITTIQIGITVLFSMAYIVVINISESVNLFKNIDLGGISYLLPPCWFAALLEIIATGNLNITLFILSFLALAIPIMSVYIYIRLIPSFEKKLQKLNYEGSSKNLKKHNLTMKLSKIICKDKEERIFFNFISKIIRMDRDFKSAIYTTMGSNAAFSIYMIFARDSNHINSYMYIFLYFYVI
uniref:ABC transporter permease n=3 Tax=Paraclostridium bifermentans TaxID=1490 RepID=UPI0022DFD8D1